MNYLILWLLTGFISFLWMRYDTENKVVLSDLFVGSIAAVMGPILFAFILFALYGDKVIYKRKIK